MIEVTFTANDVDDLTNQIVQFIGLNVQVTPVREPTLVAGTHPSDANVINPNKAKPAKKEPKAKPELEPHPDLIEKEKPGTMRSPDVDEDIGDDAALVGGIKTDTVALEALKNQQLDRLRDLFSAGKVKFVRELLAQHGGGAKVFPEVDVLAFPAIKKAIDKEMGLQ